MSDAAMTLGPLELDWTVAATWEGTVPSAARIDRARPLAVSVLEGAPTSTVPLSRLRRAVAGLAGGDLETCAAELGGAGPGLTPAGDDCLAGILLTARIRWGSPATDRLARVATSVATNDIALAFLEWAARGQCIEPVHRFLVAAARGDRKGATRALGTMLAYGHSSGADLALGLRLGLELLPAAASALA